MHESPPKPPPEQVLQAAEIYLRHAYDGAAPPTAVKNRLDTLRDTPAERFYTCECFEADPQPDPSHLCLRLGNRFYPHMKLTIDRRPDGQGYLFRADTHDRHIEVSPDSPEYAAVRQLREQNQKLSQQIERDWTEQGLPTFKAWLREDLARRRQGA